MTDQDQINKAKEFNILGREAAGTGDYEEAADFFEKAAKIYERIDDHINRGLQLFSLANCYATLIRNDQALDIYRESYDLIKNNDKLLEYQAMILNNLGHLCVSMRNYDEGRNSFEKALGIFETVKNEKAQAFQYQNIGSVYRDQRESKDALEAYSKSIAIFKKVGHKLGEADQCTNIAYIYSVDRNATEALTWYKKAYEIYVDLDEDDKSNLTKTNIEQLEKAV